MLVHHLLSGMIIGVLAAVASLLHGFPIGAAVGFYIIGANVGLAASVLGALSLRLTGIVRLTSALR
jgi:hypothetical protein